MNLDDLTPDTRLELSKYLPGKELVKLCSVSKGFRNTCTSTKFNNLWRRKIKEDFNVNYNGKDAYNEYLRQSYCDSKTYWLVEIDNRQGNYSYILNSEEEAVDFVIDSIKNEKITISEIFIQTVLENNREIEIYAMGYTISPINISHNKKKYRQKYNTFLKKLVKDLGKDGDEKLIEEINEQIDALISVAYESDIFDLEYNDIEETFTEICNEYQIQNCDVLIESIYKLLNGSIESLI